jgi:hypothetical protein
MMRKSDDELKIDISELFGGDLEPARQAAEKIEEAAANPVAADAGEAAPPAVVEQKYQDWMSEREKALEAKTQELERRLQELVDQKSQAPQAAPAVAPAEIPAPIVIEETPVMAAPVEIPAPEPDSIVQPETPAPQGMAAMTDTPPPAGASGGIDIDFSQPISAPFLQPAVPVAGAVSAEENLKQIQKEYEFLLLYDEFRNIIIHELKDLVGEKKTYKMLERTVELTREKYPEIFRNANWDAAGNLLQDGSLDSQRLVENKNSLNPSKANAVFDAGLGTLLSLRLQAVEKGLGTGMKNKIRARLYQWINEKVERAAQANKEVDDLNRLKGFVV